MDRIKIIDSVDLSDVCRGFKDNENKYSLEDVLFDEFIDVDKDTREISHYGYNGLLCEWGRAGLLEIQL